MDATEKRQVETQLLKMGLAGLQANGDPSAELVGQLASIVNNWKPSSNRHGEWIDRHKFFRDLLAECDKQHRTEMYESMLPHLSFSAYPLARYESMMTERMGALISKGAARLEGQAPRPLLVGDRTAIAKADKKRLAKKQRRARQQLSAGDIFVAESLPEDATHVMATLKCYKCQKSANFLGDTPAGAMIAGRKAGWVRDMAVVKETCPACAKLPVN